MSSGAATPFASANSANRARSRWYASCVRGESPCSSARKSVNRWSRNRRARASESLMPPARVRAGAATTRAPRSRPPPPRPTPSCGRTASMRRHERVPVGARPEREVADDAVPDAGRDAPSPASSCSGERRSAPANGGTIARTPGRNRLSTSAAAPYLPCSVAQALLALLVRELRKLLADPARRHAAGPRQYIAPAPATLPIHVARNAQTGLPCPRAASEAAERDHGVGRERRKDVLHRGERRHQQIERGERKLVSQSMKPAGHRLRGGRASRSRGTRGPRRDRSHPIPSLVLPLMLDLGDAAAERHGDPLRASRRGAVRSSASRRSRRRPPAPRATLRRARARSRAAASRSSRAPRWPASVSGNSSPMSPSAGGAEHGVGHGVGDRVAVGVATQVHVRMGCATPPSTSGPPGANRCES